MNAARIDFYTSPRFIPDDVRLKFGGSNDAQLVWSTADADNHALVLALGDSNQALHVTDVGAVASDWNVSAETHPSLYVHSNTTPATDYLKIGGHDGSSATIDLVGGTTLKIAFGGSADIDITASALSPSSDGGSALGTTALGWNGLHLKTGTTINWENGAGTITYTSDVITVADATFATAALTATSVTGSGVLKTTDTTAATSATTGSGQYAGGIGVAGNSWFDGTLDVNNSANFTGAGGANVRFRRDDASVTTGQTIGQIFAQSNITGSYGSVGLMGWFAESPWSSSDTPSKFELYTNTDGAAPNNTVLAMSVSSAQNVTFPNGNVVASAGVRIGANSGDNEIDDATQGSASATLYIGNASINVTSDIRLKTDIEDTEIDALDLLSKLRVVDFTWDDPTDTSEYGRNYRGRYTGLLAQETVKVAPWIINDQGGGRDCASCMRGRKCKKHVHPWKVEYEHLVPTLVKAIQQLNSELEGIHASK